MSFQTGAIRSLCALAAAALAAAGCGSPVGQPCPSSQSALVAVAMPHAVASDQADKSCQIVLRETKIRIGDRGAENDCSSGTCWTVVGATVDVDRAQDQNGSTPYLLYRGQSGVWHQAESTGSRTAQLGFSRYQFILSEDTFAPGSERDLQIRSFLLSADGTRLFDQNLHNLHNLNSGGGCVGIRPPLAAAEQ